MSIRKLSLEFDSLSEAQVIEMRLNHSEIPAPRCVVRGKANGAFEGAGTFQWTSAVKAVALLAVSTVLTRYEDSEKNSAAILSGGTGSLAASLDYAISKRPGWLVDTFGYDNSGGSFASTLFRRSNPERKRPGPVTIAFDSRLLAADDIEILIAGVVVRDVASLRKLKGKLGELEGLTRAITKQVLDPHGARLTLVGKPQSRQRKGAATR